MAKVSLGYAAALIRAAPPGDLLRAALRRLRRPLPPRAPSAVEIARAAEALAHVPRLFSAEDPAPLYQERFPDAIPRFRVRALRILDGEAEIFGQWRRPGSPDPKVAWEHGRGGHLVELAAATRLHPDLKPAALARITTEIEHFQELPPLDSALRAIHWLAAFELAGGVPAWFRPRLGRSLLLEGEFLSVNLEDGGVCPANHLLGDWLGLLAIGLATGHQRWILRAGEGVRAEAARQVGDDGAHFEASTAYHRFAFELLWLAHRWMGGFLPTLRKMALYTRDILCPDGSEPGFGDSDDAQLLPIVPRAPRDHSVVPALAGWRRPGPPPEELVWWRGADGLRAWDEAPIAGESRCASFADGGVHVLRSARLYLAMRAGSHGQKGVGGHAHNDQLSLVVWGDGRPLIIDPGTGSYTHDPVARDRFRGGAAHSSVLVAGEEPSPLFRDRPFALPDRARTSPVIVEDLGELASLRAAHFGYRRRGVRHQRRVTLYRELHALVIEDDLLGKGELEVEARFQLAEPATQGASHATRRRVAELDGRLGALDVERAVEIGGRAALVPFSGNPLSVELRIGWMAPQFGRILQAGLVSIGGLLSLPHTVAVVVILLS